MRVVTNSPLEGLCLLGLYTRSGVVEPFAMASGSEIDFDGVFAGLSTSMSGADALFAPTDPGPALVLTTPALLVLNCRPAALFLFVALPATAALLAPIAAARDTAWRDLSVTIVARFLSLSLRFGANSVRRTVVWF